MLPRYPVYVPSKGRAKSALTAKFLRRDGVPFHLVVEPSQVEAYAPEWGDHLLVLPEDDYGSVIPARNWIKAHATEQGYRRHWQLDDNITRLLRMWKGYRVPVEAGMALGVTEHFVDRYTNVALAGLNYEMFAVNNPPPFWLNVHVYSCTLVLNELPHEWRGPYNEDTDLCLQVLADGWCTVLMNAFLATKVRTMVLKGGNTQELYHGDGRLKMARLLEKRWPGVVDTRRKFQRPQHHIKGSWKHFDQQLIRRPDLELEEGTNEFGMQLQEQAEVQSPTVKQLAKDFRKEVD